MWICMMKAQSTHNFANNDKRVSHLEICMMMVFPEYDKHSQLYSFIIQIINYILLRALWPVPLSKIDSFVSVAMGNAGRYDIHKISFRFSQNSDLQGLFCRQNHCQPIITSSLLPPFLSHVSLFPFSQLCLWLQSGLCVLILISRVMIPAIYIPHINLKV
jgi:hypothetical protein